MAFDPPPIALLDSGVGGLSILNEVRKLLPNEDVIYFADQGHVPYGPRSGEEITSFVEGMTRFFLGRDAKVIVIACNTASATSLHAARATFPQIPFVGMEPAVKPAAAQTRQGVIGVIATQATSQSALFASVIDRFASDVEVVTQACPTFVKLVEEGKLDTPEVYEAAEGYLRPMVEAGIDQLVIGCTHFPFLMPVLQEVVGPDVQIVDPGPAVARQVGRVIAEKRNSADHTSRVTYFTSGDREAFLPVARRLVEELIEDEQVHAVRWEGDKVMEQGWEID